MECSRLPNHLEVKPRSFCQIISSGVAKPSCAHPTRPRPSRKGHALTASSAGEIRRSLLQEGAYALGIVGVEARLALKVSLEVELGVEIVLLGRIKRLLDQAEPEA